MQIRPYPAATLTRNLGRGARLPSTQLLRQFGASIDSRRAISLLRRLLSGDLRVIGEVARDESDARPAFAVFALGLLSASLGAWLWLVLNTGGADIGGAALRVLLFGSLAALAAWTLWLGVSWHALRSIFAVEADLPTQARTMALVGGFAVWQVCLFAGPASFAVGLITTIAGVLLAVLAVRAAAPEADDRAAVISVGLGFGVYALALSLLADLVGVGAGVFVHAIG